MDLSIHMYAKFIFDSTVDWKIPTFIEFNLERRSSSVDRE